MRLRQTLVIAFVSFVLISLPFYRFMGEDWLNRIQKQEIANEKIMPLRANLYAPADAVLLKESKGFVPLNYFGDCSGARITLIYGVNRLFDAIREEYDKTLLASDWEINQGYSSEQYYAVYEKGPETDLTLDFSSDVINPTDQVFSTIYSVSLSYMTPSNNRCTG